MVCELKTKRERNDLMEIYQQWLVFYVFFRIFLKLMVEQCSFRSSTSTVISIYQFNIALKKQL